ncbi:MAG: hypothetical protein Q9M94_01580 [Candidatus Gracilibacteria bacterium]|nr:hypothetical protein [Candidatus Gracilibacteria bacterium]
MPKKNKINNKVKVEEVKVFQQFKKQQLFQQITFVFAAMVIGFGINSFVLNGDLSNNLKANILETNKKVEKQSDLYIQKTIGKDSNLMILKTSKNIDKVKSISFSLTYNPEDVEIQDIFPNINTSRLENEKGITTFIINFNEVKNIKSGEEIINFYTSKKEGTSQNINLINANFTDSTNTRYDLTTSGIIF